MQNTSWKTYDLKGDAKGKPVRVQARVANPFQMKGQWIKANLHCHLAGIDHGRPDWTATAPGVYHALGYGTIAGMDHDRLVPVDTDLPVLIVPGAELSPGHLLALGVDRIPPVDRTAERFQATLTHIRQIREVGGMAVLAHPFNSNWTLDEIKAMVDAGLEGFEVCNTASWLKGATDRSDQLWHALHEQGIYLAATGADDAHGPDDVEDPRMAYRRGWTGILVDDFTVEAVMAALRAGRSYASEGPVVEGIQLSDSGVLEVATSTVTACHVRSGGGNCGGITLFPAEHKQVGNRFTLDLARMGYRFKESMTIVLEDEHGRYAWISPIRIETTLTDDTVG